MKVLLIGLNDNKDFKIVFEKVFDMPITYFQTDKISNANELIEEKDIDFFVCDNKFSFSEIDKFIETLGDYDKTTVRGAFVGDVANNPIAMLAINSMIIDGLLMRPYVKEDFYKMKKRYLKVISSAYFKK